MSDYQYLPPLSDDEFAALKADIAKRGVLVHIEYDDQGNLIEGHHRMRAVDELRADGQVVADPPTVVRTFASEDDKIAHILTLNLARRHLTTYQRTQVEADLRERGWSFRRIAEKIGVNASTVQRDLARVASATPEADQGDDGSRVANATPVTVQGKDGKSYARNRPKAKRRPRTPVASSQPTTSPTPVANATPEADADTVRTVVVPDRQEKVTQWLIAGVELVENDADRLLVQQCPDDAERVWAGLFRLLYPTRPIATVKVRRGVARRP